MFQGILRLLVLFAIGAIIFDVLSHPTGTKTVLGGIDSLLKHGYQAAGGSLGGGASSGGGTGMKGKGKSGGK